MVKKEPKKKLDLSVVKGVGSAFRDIIIVAAAHPVTAGLTIMALATIGKIINNRRSETIDWELGGVYGGAQTIASAAVVVPVVGSALEAVTALAKKRAAAGT